MRWSDVALGIPIGVAATSSPLAVGELSPGEQAQLPGGDGGRRGEWLRGRAALKLLLGGVDTSALTVPHPELSLTHAAGWAVAARCEEGAPAGLGVDFEGPRRIDPRTARFFLGLHEQAPAPMDQDDLLRLWTVKEALFKATPDNRGATLLDCGVADPGALAGSARDVVGRQFRYVSRPLRHGWLTIAVCPAAA
jgi:hypothetical protein